MHRFWPAYIKPIVDTLGPEHIVEIGAEFGWNTAKLLEYCEANGAQLDVVDPVSNSRLDEVLARFPASVTYHPVKSLAAIPRLQPAQLVLLDGDHNWFTVYNELQLLYLHAANAGAVPPVVLLHDIAWPYARRDMYYDPASIEVENRQPFAYRGMLPGQSELNDAGLNGRFANAVHEGGPRNGVRTALEDFHASLAVKTTLHMLPFFSGLGILVPDARMTPELAALIEHFFSADSLLEACTRLEMEAMVARAELGVAKTQAANRADALARFARAETPSEVAAESAAGVSGWTRLKSRIRAPFP